MLENKVDGIDRTVSGIANETMQRAYLQTIGDVNEITFSLFMDFENAVGCELFSHLAKKMPFEEGEK